MSANRGIGALTRRIAVATDAIADKPTSAILVPSARKVRAMATVSRMSESSTREMQA